MSNARVEGDLLEPYVEFCTSHIHHIIETIGPRPPGSAEEHHAQEYLAELLREMGAAPRLEPFTLAPKAFMGFIPISGGLLLASLLLYGWLPLGALGAVLLALGLLVGELVLYRELVDPLFRRVTSHNLVASVLPRGDVKQVLLLGGHCDSAFEWRYHYQSRWLLFAVVGGALVGALALVVATSASLFVHGVGGPPAGSTLSQVGWVLWAFALPFLLVMGFSSFRRVSPGANDNLTGVLLSLALLKRLQDQGVTLEHTELRLLNTGAEEAGLRGARAYAEAHRAELLAVPSLYVALDTFSDLDHMKIYDRDLNGMLRHDPAGAQLLQAAARRAGFAVPFGTIPVGATDAAAFTRAGLRAIALVAMDPAPPRWYHTRLDTPDRLSPECIAAGLRILIELVRTVDAERSLEAALEQARPERP